MHRHKKCLSEVELGAYIEGRLSPDKKESLDRRLAECRECRRELAAVKQVLSCKDPVRMQDAPEALIRKVIKSYPVRHGFFDIILSLVKDSIDVVRSSPYINIFSPVPLAGLRNRKVMSPRMIVITKAFDNIDVELDIEKLEDDLCNIKVLASESGTGILMNNLRVDLVSEWRELDSSLLQNGEVIFEDINPGRYLIKIHKNGMIFGELIIKIE